MGKAQGAADDTEKFAMFEARMNEILKDPDMFISTVSSNLVDAPESMQKGVRFKLAQNQRARDGAEHVHYVSCVNFQDGLKDILQLQKGDPLTVNGRTTIAQNRKQREDVPEHRPDCR